MWVKPPRVLSLMAHPSQLGFQDAASPVIEELLHFHDHALIIVFLISTLVLYIILAIVTRFRSSNDDLSKQPGLTGRRINST